MTTYLTRYGVVYHRVPCRDDWPNIVERDRNGYTLKLQRSAMRSFLKAEKALGRKIQLTGSWRSCAYQATLYAQDSSRYASPNGTLHTQGLAIDVSTAQPDQAVIRGLLLKRGWHQARPSDEPWHFSFRLTA